MVDSRESGKQKQLVFLSFGLELFLLPSSNIGEEVKGCCESIEDVS